MVELSFEFSEGRVVIVLASSYRLQGKYRTLLFATVLTFGDRKERKRHHCIAMCAAHAIVRISEGNVCRMVLDITGGYRHGGLVASEKNRRVHSTICCGIILVNFILSNVS